MKIKFYFLTVFIFLPVFLLFQNSLSFGAPILNNSSNANNKHNKTDIKSDSLTVNNKTHIAVFTGHVVALKGKLKILSSVLKIIYTKKNKIKILIATGNVHIIKGKDNITGGRAVYYDKKKIAVITENPVAYEGKNRIAGKKIIINFKTGISTVIGGPKRVNAVVYSKKSIGVKKNNVKTKKQR
jgi:lipopolysaccharide export system protein LptA